MRGMIKASFASSLLALASHGSAQVASVCPSDNVCFKLNIPESTASSGSGDIFFQISAPSSYEWVALGQGHGMANSNMFVVYSSLGGSNVTLSPRKSSGHSQPSVNGDANVELLEGSGVSNGVMTANVKCSNCNSWSGGSMDFTSGSGNWIYGYQSSGGPKDSDDQSASIKQHSEKDSFSWDFANAKGGDSVNPLVNEVSSGNGNDNTTVGITPISSSNGGVNKTTMLIAHGVLASLAFVILFPAGAIAIRLATFPGILWLHAAFQVFAYIVYIAGFGLGVYLARESDELSDIHPGIGIFIFFLIFLQPISGYVHHALFKKHKHRTFWSYAHIWIGRIAVTLGIVNGGLGLKLADGLNMGSQRGIIIYGVIAGLAWVLWVAAIFIGERRKKRAMANAAPKHKDSPRDSERGETGSD